MEKNLSRILIIFRWSKEITVQENYHQIKLESVKEKVRKDKIMKIAKNWKRRRKKMLLACLYKVLYNIFSKNEWLIYGIIILQIVS